MLTIAPPTSDFASSGNNALVARKTLSRFTRKDRSPLRQRGVSDRAEGAVAGIVDQDVEPAVARLDLSRECRPAVLIGDVEDDAEMWTAGQLSERGG